MLIRSQDKLSTTTDLNIEILETYEYDGFELCTVSGIDLGVYSTEEKAKKVLDMIQEEYKSQLTKNKVFQMPQDNEVDAEGSSPVSNPVNK